jgi:hypothetical protein
MPSPVLYKYVRLSSAHTSELLTNPALYFARPGDFNDPFDCRAHYTFRKPKSKEELEIWHKTAVIALAHHDPRFTGKPDPALVKEYLQRFPRPDDALAAAVLRVLQADIQNKLIGVLCLTATGTDPVMYYHYCENHTGICLRFKPREDSFFWHAEPVGYGNEYPEVEFFDDSDLPGQFESIFLRKYSGWAYENEWRVIDYINGPGVRPYPPALLTGVIFGMKTTGADKDRVRDCLEKRGQHVELLQAMPQERNYQMRLDSLGNI